MKQHPSQTQTAVTVILAVADRNGHGGEHYLAVADRNGHGGKHYQYK